MLVVGHTDGLHYLLPYFEAAFFLAFPDTQIAFERDPAAEPDILLFSVFGESSKRYSTKKICVSGEPFDLSGVQCDLLLDCKDVPALRPAGTPFAYLPFYMLSFVERFQNVPSDLVKPPGIDVQGIKAQKTEFCAFLYWNSVDFRNALYDAISGYQPVRALGKSRGPVDLEIDRGHYDVGRSTYNDLAVEKYRPYKFVVCCENSLQPGYVTEKIVSAMLASAIPIYLGAPDVARHFNPASFINVSDFGSLEDAVKYIQRVNEDDSLYFSMLREPWFENNRLPQAFDPGLVVPAIRALMAPPEAQETEPALRPVECIDIFRGLIALRNRVKVPDHPSTEELAFLAFCAANAVQSQAQLMQDLFVLYCLESRRNGFFVEFGATDGVTISNTVLLERQFGWTGILAEPARYWHERLRANRGCTISTHCVWHTSGQTLLFNETPDRELSTIDRLSLSDGHAISRVHGDRYEVPTVSLLDLLRQCQAPEKIDYLSIDTEGSEVEILSAFDFEKYEIQIITVEHNHTANRQRLHDLLVARGYERKFEALSQWDDWYLRRAD